MMLKGIKYRIYPTNPQKELIAKHIGSSRFVYNLALETKNVAYLGNKHNFLPFDLIVKKNTGGTPELQACGDERLLLSVKQEAHPIASGVGG